jgi:signal-transduction protein with cAMP-binding, CBS, and nucleotidyltransferase domain
MHTSVIRLRVADFLKQHAPFDALSEQDLLELAGSGKVKFHESDEYLFRSGAPKGEFLWMIQQGRVELLDGDADTERLRDVLGEGDLLGLDRFTGNGQWQSSARTATDVILYAVSAELFETLLARYPALSRFLSAHFSVSGNLGFNRASWLEAEAPPLDFLRARLAGTRRALESPSPTVAPPLSTRTAVREMLRARVDTLAITADGTPSSPLDAILTASELSLFCNRNPAALISAIRHAASAAEIAPLLRLATPLVRDALAQPQDVDDCCRINLEVIAAVADACIRLAASDVRAEGIAAPETPYCWVLFGASARGDLLRPELPTIAAIHDDSDGAALLGDSLYFAVLAGKAAARFHALGLSGPGLHWPEGAGPSMPLSEWKRLYSETIREPLLNDLYARRLFLDMSPLSGDMSILGKVREHILLELRGHKTAIPLLANDTLAHLPPLTFFRGLVLDLDGAQRDSFDIAQAVISPLADAARVFALAQRRLTPANTLERFENAILDFPRGAGVLRQAADAFRIGLYYQTLAGGTRIDSAKLGKFDQLLLKTAFSSIQAFLDFTVSTFVPGL